jgi:hypothetical protein
MPNLDVSLHLKMHKAQDFDSMQTKFPNKANQLLVNIIFLNFWNAKLLAHGRLVKVAIKLDLYWRLKISSFSFLIYLFITLYFLIAKNFFIKVFFLLMLITFVTS